MGIMKQVGGKTSAVKSKGLQEVVVQDTADGSQDFGLSIGPEGAWYKQCLQGKAAKLSQVFAKDAAGDMALVSLLTYISMKGGEQLSDECLENMDELVASWPKIRKAILKARK